LIKKYQKIKKENLPAGKAGIYSTFLSCVLIKLLHYCGEEHYNIIQQCKEIFCFSTSSCVRRLLRFGHAAGMIAAMAQPYCAKKRRQRRCMNEAQRLERKK